MPPKRATCLNPEFLQIILNLRDQHEEGAHLYMVYNKAAKSMQTYGRVLANPDEARDVKHVGPAIVKELQRQMKSTSRSSNVDSPPPPARARKSQSRATASSSQSVLAPEPNFSSNRHVPAPQTRPPVAGPVPAEDGIFKFCYLEYDAGGRERRVELKDTAFINIDLDNPALLIEYPRSSQNLAEPNGIISPHGPRPPYQTFIGYLPLQIADLHYPRSTLPLDWHTTLGVPPLRPPTAATKSTLKRSATEILAAENVAFQKRTKGMLDPSRQAPTGKTWSVSSSQSAAQKGPIPDRGSASKRVDKVSLGRSLTMPDMPPQPPPISSSSSTPLRPLQQQRAGSASYVTLQRTDSAPTATQTKARARVQARNRPRLSHALQPPPIEMDIDLEDPYASSDRVVFPEFAPLVISKDTFDVVLVLDNREIKSGSNRSGIFDGLRSKQIPVVRDALSVGDVSWIAKRKPQFRDGTEYDEITLDFILERKRLDDLVASIKDGRFHEQKFRLSNTAITNVFYLVEEYTLKGEEQEKNVFDLAIDTALSQTQMIEKFMVKETKSVNDTISYYAILHQQIVAKYRGQDLYVIPSGLIKRHNYVKFQKKLRLKSSGMSHLISYEMFSELNSKSGFITVRETWARLLLSIKGVSAEKAGALVHKFPTCKPMYFACLQAQQQEKEDEEDEQVEIRRGGKPRKKKDVFLAKHFLKDVGGNTGRNVGPALSERIYRQMMDPVYVMGEFGPEDD